MNTNLPEGKDQIATVAAPVLNVGVVNCHVGYCEPELPSQDQPMCKLSNRLVSVSQMPRICRSREIATSKASTFGVWISAARSHRPFAARSHRPFVV